MKTSLHSLLTRLRNRHFLIADVVLLAVAPPFALFLRVETMDQFHRFLGPILIYTVFSLLWKPLLFRLAGLYRRYWPYASVDAMITVLVATGLSALIEVVVFAIVLFPLGWIVIGLPRSIPFISGMATMLLIGGSRFSIRLLAEFTKRQGRRGETRPVLIVGAGIAGAMVVKELRSNPQVGLEPVGFLDDDPGKIGLRIQSVPVLGSIDELEVYARQLAVREVVIAMPTAPGRVIRSILQECEKVGVQSKTVPGIFEILSGSAKVSQIRDIDIQDLLRRGPVKTDTEGVSRLVSGACVMVTGAGGSIGSELCRQIIGFQPSDLVLLGHGENSIFGIAGELRKSSSIVKGHVRIHAVIGDIRDPGRMEQVFTRYRPLVVFHAAAHKHVGLMESNLPDAISNNVLGTRILVELAPLHGTERLVMISSDKAVNPTSVMGVTKRIAERIVQDAAIRSGKAFVSVRFGNVLGSRGSVVPIFKAQIASGGPVCVTHPEATRYFMTIPEAVQLVLQAAALGRGGEVFVLDMGEAIRILDLARDVIRLSGLEEGTDIDIRFTGLKRGEKLHEELFYASEVPERSSHEKIFVCQTPIYHSISHLLSGMGVSGDMRNLMAPEGPPVMATVEQLVAAAGSGAIEEIKDCLRRLVPQYVAGSETYELQQRSEMEP